MDTWRGSINENQKGQINHYSCGKKKIYGWSLYVISICKIYSLPAVCSH
jgi:hypothetical protein